MSTQAFWKKLLGIRADEEAARKMDLDGAIQTAADGREAELDPAHVFEILKTAGLSTDDFADRVRKEKERRANVKAVAAGRQAADRHRELSVQRDELQAKFYADSVELKRVYVENHEKIDGDISPLNQIMVAADTAQRALLEAAQNERFRGMSRDEKIQQVQDELASAAAQVAHVRDMETAEKIAGATVQARAAELKDAKSDSDVEEATQSLKDAKARHAIASRELTAARQRLETDNRQRASEEAEILGLATAG